MVKIKMPEGFHTFFSRTGKRLEVDVDGCIEVEDLSQEHLDLMATPGAYAVGNNNPPKMSPDEAPDPSKDLGEEVV